MSLFNDEWIPIQFPNGRVRKIGMRELLCSELEGIKIEFWRDDLSFAALHLLVCLTQCAFAPVDHDEWLQRLASPLTNEEFDAPGGLPHRLSWFDVRHPETPFMQRTTIKPNLLKAKSVDPFPIQKIFLGLPAGQNHAMFNNPGEIGSACAGCVAVALFNQANNCSAIGRGFKSGLRGNSPVTTLVAGRSLRETIWRNVLVQPRSDQPLPDLPVWVDLVRDGEKIQVNQIGLIRGLFWQPLALRIANWASGICDLCGEKTKVAKECQFERFLYDLDDTWPHPHSPRHPDRKGFLSFGRHPFPWCYLPEMTGQTAAQVVTQANDKFDGLFVGGYWADQAKIFRRFHGRLATDPDALRHAAILRQLVEVLGIATWATAKKFNMEPRNRKAVDEFWLRAETWGIHEDPRQWVERTVEIFEEFFTNVHPRFLPSRDRLRADLFAALSYEFGIEPIDGEPDIDFNGIEVRQSRSGRKPSTNPSPAALAQRRSRAGLAIDQPTANLRNGIEGGRPRTRPPIDPDTPKRPRGRPPKKS